MTPRILLSAETIAARVAELGAEIARDHSGHELVLVCVLKGSYVFAADLARAIDLPLRVEFLGVQSYGDGTTTSGEVRITLDVAHALSGKHVLLVEDIVDTGLTLSFLLEHLRSRDLASLKVCSLLHKPSRARVKVPVDYVGFTIEDEFVVGYGLDHAGLHRNLPYIGIGNLPE
jgi:hypoxanthine phosphoribosyltransferase